MKTPEEISLIRKLYQEGMSKSEIARTTHCSWPTVMKYVGMTDFNEPEPAAAQESVEDKSSILDPYKAIIREWLEADKSMPYKQRHTNTRIFNRLVNEKGYKGSRPTVDNYVRKLRDELHVYKKKSDGEGYMPLEHYPGMGQGDFGKACFKERRSRHCGSFFSLDLPFSNQAYIQLTYGENLECLLESLQAIFHYIGGVPLEIWFDNASCITGFDSNGRRAYTADRFILFAQHYGFKYRFMNRAEGHEKGAVENSVGTYRNNLLVPIPEFESLEEKNKELLRECEDFREEARHYKKGAKIGLLREEDKAALLPLPNSPFDTARYERLRTDKCGIFTMHNGLHRYSSAPNYSECELIVRITASKVEVMDDKRHPIVTHPRLYGRKDEHMERIDYVPYLKYMSRKPNTFWSTPFREIMPRHLQRFLGGLSNTDLGKALGTLWDLTQKEGGLEPAVARMAGALQEGTIGELVSGIDSGKMAANARPQEARAGARDAVPVQEASTPSQDLKEFDSFLKGVF